MKYLFIQIYNHKNSVFIGWLSTTSKNFACKETFWRTGEQWTFWCPKRVNYKGPHWVEILKAHIKYFCYIVFIKQIRFLKGKHKIVIGGKILIFSPKKVLHCFLSEPKVAEKYFSISPFFPFLFFPLLFSLFPYPMREKWFLFPWEFFWHIVEYWDRRNKKMIMNKMVKDSNNPINKFCPSFFTFSHSIFSFLFSFLFYMMILTDFSLWFLSRCHIPFPILGSSLKTLCSVLLLFMLKTLFLQNRPAQLGCAA